MCWWRRPGSVSGRGRRGRLRGRMRGFVRREETQHPRFVGLPLFPPGADVTRAVDEPEREHRGIAGVHQLHVARRDVLRQWLLEVWLLPIAFHPAVRVRDPVEREDLNELRNDRRRRRFGVVESAPRIAAAAKVG